MGRGQSKKSEDLIEAAATILGEIQPATVRAVCYQCFIRKLIPSMAKAETNRMSFLLTRARLETRIPWEWIVQEGQEIESIPTWADPAAFGRAVTSQYRRNKWAGQPTRVIVVSEKGTIRGTLAPVLDEFEVEFLPLGGVSSTTRVHELSQLAIRSAQRLLPLYLGDYDCSGMFMSERDLPRRFVQYASANPSIRLSPDEVVYFANEWGLDVVKRIAVLQADTLTLGRRLAFPASDKRKDPHYRWFVEHYGDWCWEVDAMNPNDLLERVRGAILAELDRAAWDRYVTAEAVELDSIVATVRTWNGISGLAPK